MVLRKKKRQSALTFYGNSRKLLDGSARRYNHQPTYLADHARLLGGTGCDP